MTIELRYNVTDKVYYINKQGKIQLGEIVSCHFKRWVGAASDVFPQTITYILKDIRFAFDESKLFSTREELKESL